MLISPTVNINGTDGRDLLQQHIDAWNAVLNACVSLRAAAPNGRDFQTVGADVYIAARRQHEAWLLQLDAVAKGLEEISIKISDQITR